MPSESMVVGAFTVTKTRIIGTNHFVFDCWEPSSYFGPHGCTMTINGQVHGRVSSKALPKRIADMSQGQARWDACDAHRAALEEQAYAAILVAYPEAVRGHRTMGSIDLYLSSAPAACTL